MEVIIAEIRPYDPLELAVTAIREGLRPDLIVTAKKNVDGLQGNHLIEILTTKGDLVKKINLIMMADGGVQLIKAT